MSDESHIIPKHLDAPPMFLLWEADEAGAFIMPLMVVFMFKPGLFNLIVGSVIGVFSMRLMARVKTAGGKQLFKHALYWYTPTEVMFKFRRTPSSDIREFIGG